MLPVQFPIFLGFIWEHNFKGRKFLSPFFNLRVDSVLFHKIKLPLAGILKHVKARDELFWELNLSKTFNIDWQISDP